MLGASIFGRTGKHGGLPAPGDVPHRCLQQTGSAQDEDDPAGLSRGLDCNEACLKGSEPPPGAITHRDTMASHAMSCSARDTSQASSLHDTLGAVTAFRERGRKKSDCMSCRSTYDTPSYRGSGHGKAFLGLELSASASTCSPPWPRAALRGHLEACSVGVSRRDMQPPGTDDQAGCMCGP